LNGSKSSIRKSWSSARRGWPAISPSPSPTGTIVDAAGGCLRHELGVSQPLWGEAGRILGRQRAAVTLAIVSTKPKGYFSRGAGVYFAAMVKRAKTGELNLDRSLWKLRREGWGGAAKGRSRVV
jgi:Replication protein C C-terminal region